MQYSNIMDIVAFLCVMQADNALQQAWFYPKYHQGKTVMQFFFWIVAAGYCFLKKLATPKYRVACNSWSGSLQTHEEASRIGIFQFFPSEWQKFSGTVPLVSCSYRNKTTCIFKSDQNLEFNKIALTGVLVSLPHLQTVTLPSVFAGH